jgi:hypothetical protein
VRPFPCQLPNPQIPDFHDNLNMHRFGAFPQRITALVRNIAVMRRRNLAAFHRSASLTAWRRGQDADAAGV